MRACADGRGARAPGGARAGGWAALAAAAVLACSTASPETEAREALARLGPVELEAGRARLSLARAAFSDVALSVDGPRAHVVAVVEADGRARLPGGAEPEVVYVGREAFRMERCSARRWCLAPDALAGLRGVVAALAAAPRPAGARVLAWQVRVERDAAEAGEDYEAPEGGTARRLRARHALARDGAGFRLVPPP